MSKSQSASGWEIKEKGWEKVQIKAFTSWLNEYLSKRDLCIENIKTDLGDGVKLINFLELLSGKNVTVRYDPTPPSRIQKIQNLHIALQFLQKEMEVRLISIGAEGILTLPNCDVVRLRRLESKNDFRIFMDHHIEDKSSEEGLLLWVQKTTEEYQDVTIESYKQSFRNGLAFLALCDKYLENKEHFDFVEVSRYTSVECLAQAFEIAEKELGIPKLLEPQEVAEGNVDERSLVLYISLFFHAFMAKEQQLLAEQEKNRIEERMRGLEGSLDERVKLAADLESENKRLREVVEMVMSQLKAEQEAKAELIEKDTYLEEKVEVLKQLLEQESEEKEELEKARQLFETEIQELKDRIQLVTKAQEEVINELEDMKQKLQLEKDRALKEEETKLSLEEQILGLKTEVIKLSSKLEEESKQRIQESKERSSQNSTEITGLEVLKRNLEEHLEDLHRWENYLDVDKLSQLDFEGEVRPQVIAEISKQTFEQQLANLSHRLEKENVELFSLLKAKEAEAKSKQLQEKKKRDRQVESHDTI